MNFTRNLFPKTLLMLAPLLVSIMAISTASQVQAQNLFGLNDQDYATLLDNARQNGVGITAAAIQIAKVLDPADHQCCVAPPPETVDLELNSDGITVSSPDPEHWLNFTFPLDETSPAFEGETSSTVAGFEDVRNTFMGEVFQDGVQIVATLGADGELFDETIVYTLDIMTGDLLAAAAASIPDITQAPVEKVKTANGKETEASFESGASADGGESTGNEFSTSDNVIIAGTVNIDPADQGKAGEVYVVLLSVNSNGVALSFLNEAGNYEVWNQTVAGLGAHIVTDSLSTSYNVTVSTGTLLPGTYRVALAYSRGSNLVYAPKAIVVNVSD